MADFSEEQALKNCCGDRNLLQKIIHLSLKDMPETIGEMYYASENKEWLELKRLAHKIKGLAMVCGAKNICAAALKVELSSKLIIDSRDVDALSEAFRKYEHHPRIEQLIALDSSVR